MNQKDKEEWFTMNYTKVDIDKWSRGSLFQ